jgi:hypothetical protein
VITTKGKKKQSTIKKVSRYQVEILERVGRKGLTERVGYQNVT